MASLGVEVREVLRSTDLPLLGLEGGLLYRAFRESVYMHAKEDFGLIVSEMGQILDDDLGVVLVGVEGGHPRAVGVILFPTGALAPLPQILHFYNEGKPETKRAVLRAGMDFLRQKGYNQAYAVNMSGRSDRAWVKAFEGPKRLIHQGSIYLVEFD